MNTLDNRYSSYSAPGAHSPGRMQEVSADAQPASVGTYVQGYYADWNVQAGFFKNGSAIHGDVHHRRLVFADGSCVEIQAHVPVPTTSGWSRGMVAASFFGFGSVGAVAGLAFAGPVGAAFGGVVGAVSGTVALAKERPYDAAWQGYTAKYYSGAAGAEAWGTRYFYSQIASDNPLKAISMNGELNPAAFADFAVHPENHVWMAWRTGSAAPRLAADITSDDYSAKAPTLPVMRSASAGAVGRNVAQFIQSSAAFDPLAAASLSAPVASGWPSGHAVAPSLAGSPIGG